MNNQPAGQSPQPHNPRNPQNPLRNDIISHEVIKVEGVVGSGGNERLRIINRARAYVATCDPCVSGSNGHGQLLYVAGVIWNGFALDEDATLEILREYNQTCLPPWAERDLVHKVNEVSGRTGHVQHRQPRGYLLGTNSRWRRPAGAPFPDAPQRDVWVVGKKSLPFEENAVAAPPDDATGGEIDPYDFVPLVPVPGCRVGRPPEIHVDDETWRAVEASGFIEEPQIQLALLLFGPGCRVMQEPTNL